MNRTVWRVAGATVFRYRGVLPQIWAALFGVAVVTGFINGLAHQLRINGCAVRAVTIATPHLAFEKRVRKRL